MFSGYSGVGGILFKIFLGFVCYCLLALLLIMICVTLAHDDQIFITSDTLPLIDNIEKGEDYKSESELNNISGKCLKLKRILFRIFLVPIQAYHWIFNIKTFHSDDYIQVI